MTIKTAKLKFEKLKEKLLADSIIDWNETDELLEFIEPYVRAENKPFVKFKSFICFCRKDGKISKIESAALIGWINMIHKFLRVEERIEWVFAIVVIGGLLIWLCI